MFHCEPSKIRIPLDGCGQCSERIEELLVLRKFTSDEEMLRRQQQGRPMTEDRQTIEANLSPPVSRFIKRLKLWRVQGDCPPEVASAIGQFLGDDESDFRDVAKQFYKKSVQDLSSDMSFWDNLVILPFLPQVAVGYYLPAILEQALMRLRSCTSTSDILSYFMPPPDNRKRNRMISYADKMARYTPEQRQLFAAFLNLILSNPLVFRDEQEAAKKCFDRFWKESQVWFDRLSK